MTSPLHTTRAIAADIKIAHSVFALPFALLAAFMAAVAVPVSSIDWASLSGQLALIVGAMVLARTVAMLANRLLDRDIDAGNPRTASRAIPSGRVSVRGAALVLAACAIGFVCLCAVFGAAYGNWWPTVLAVPVLAWISTYPLLKRFTALCHLYLGASLAISPLAAAIAINPAALGTQPALWLLSGMVLCWVAGFDIIYALQDIEADQRQHLFSMPGTLGERGALRVSRALHAVAAVCLIAAVWIDARLGAIFSTGVGLVIAVLLYEQFTVARWGRSRMALAFFTLNGIISCVLGAFGVVDVLFD